MDRAFTIERITKTKQLIVALEDAILALAPEGGVISYTLDTAQSRQTVTRSDLPALERQLDRLYNRYATLEARLKGLTTQVRPAW